METIKQVLADVEKFENYVLIKSDAITYLSWAFLSLLGTIASYTIEVFGRALSINDEYLGPLHGLIWTFIIGAALLSPSIIIPLEERAALKNDETMRQLNNKISVSWAISFLIGITIGMVMTKQYSFEPGYLWGIMIAVGLGNLIMGIMVKQHTKGPLSIGVFILAISPLVLYSLFPYYMFYFGLTMAAPYYALGVYYYKKALPALLSRQ